jgi:hypothetical protein
MPEAVADCQADYAVRETSNGIGSDSKALDNVNQ